MYRNITWNTGSLTMCFVSIRPKRDFSHIARTWTPQKLVDTAVEQQVERNFVGGNTHTHTHPSEIVRNRLSARSERWTIQKQAGDGGDWKKKELTTTLLKYFGLAFPEYSVSNNFLKLNSILYSHENKTR